MNKLFHRWTTSSWKVFAVCLSKQARSCKEQMNVNIIPKCIWKLILQLCVTSKCSVLIFTRLSQLLRPIKLTTNTIVNESEYKAESKRRDKCLRRAEQAGGKVKGAAVCGNSWTNRDWDKERTLFCKKFSFISSSSTSHQGKQLLRGLEHLIWRTKVWTGKTWATRCKLRAGRWPTGSGTSAQGLWKEFPRGLHKKSFQKCSIKYTWRKTVRRRLGLALFSSV